MTTYARLSDGKLKDMTGQRFGRLTVISHAGSRPYGRGSAAAWHCRCDCSNEVVVLGVLLRSGNNRSCGCAKRGAARSRCLKHGHAGRANKSPEYIAWLNMRRRCFNKNGPTYERYGGRGITVCDRWMHGEAGMSGVECFIADMGPRPSPKHSIDRIDNDGAYAPLNCRWATQSQQVRNSIKASRVQTKDGTVCKVEAAERAGIPYRLFTSRLQCGWSTERALSEPVTVAKTITVNGRQMTFKEAAAVSPISVSGIKSRIRNGWSPEAAVFTPPQKVGPKHAGGA